MVVFSSEVARITILKKPHLTEMNMGFIKEGDTREDARMKTYVLGILPDKICLDLYKDIYKEEYPEPSDEEKVIENLIKSVGWHRFLRALYVYCRREGRRQLEQGRISTSQQLTILEKIKELPKWVK